LFTNLKQLSQDHVLFGHHDALAYGFNWRNEPNRSDVKDITGSHPAVYGWDVSRLFRRRGTEYAPQRAAQLRKWIGEGYERGSVITLCWHMPNPATNTDAWDTTRVVYKMLPGGDLHEGYKAKLDVLADFLKSLHTGSLTWLGLGQQVPVIFRPFHEHTGNWFWWGQQHSTVEEFKHLWRFTVTYLRDEKQVENLLYAYSTDVFDSEEEYLERYPGDEYIDLLGFDDYHSIRTVETRDVLTKRLRIVAGLAEARGKLAALTETGVETVPDSTWWTQVLLPGIQADTLGQRIAFVMVWRNANNETDRSNHFYAPYPGHHSEADFIRFYQDPYVLFENQLPNLYQFSRR
jgi:mannan endo-1,4-beta-mannosidase